MKEEKLKERVYAITAMWGDPEAAHSAEDDLHIELIKLYCPAWVVEEIDRLSKADFPRWCA